MRMESGKQKQTFRPVSLYYESIGVQYVQKVAQLLVENNPICNLRKLEKLGKRITPERQTALMVELLSRNPRPAVDYLGSGLLRRAEITGDGTKKSPYRAEWCDDYFRN